MAVTGPGGRDREKLAEPARLGNGGETPELGKRQVGDVLPDVGEKPVLWVYRCGVAVQPRGHMAVVTDNHLPVPGDPHVEL